MAAMSAWHPPAVAVSVLAAVTGCQFSAPAALDAATGNQPTVAFAQAASSADEASGTLLVPVTLSAPAETAITVAYAVTGGTAIATSDFTIDGASLRFGVGDTQATIAVAILADADSTESDETIVLSLSAPTDAALGAITDHTITIADHVLPRVQFAELTSSTVESTQTLLVLSLDKPSEGVSTVRLDITGTATPVQDFTLASGTIITFQDHQQTAMVSIGEVDDALDEDDEVMTLTLAEPSANLVLGAGAHSTHTITDNDATPTVSFAVVSSSVAESAGSVTVAVSLSAASGRTVTVPFTVSSATATTPADFTVSTSPLTFAPGVTTQLITFSIVNDTLDEIDDAVSISLGTPTNATALAPTQHTLTILDDDGPSTVQFDPLQADGEANEGNPPTITTNFTYDVVLNRPSGRSISVQIDFTGDADAGDFTALGIPVTFQPGEVRKTITLQIIADNVNEPGASDTVIMTINPAGSTNCVVGANDERRHQITDDD